MTKKRRTALKETRQIIRGQFNQTANELENTGKLFVSNNIAATLEEPIAELGRNIAEIRNTRENTGANCQEM